MRDLDASANGQKIVVPLGETFQIDLSENRTTGFRWEMEADGEPACVLVSDRYEAADGVPGRGGRHCWEFQAKQSGESVIALAYRRAWGQKATEPQTFRLAVQVAPESSRSAG